MVKLLKSTKVCLKFYHLFCRIRTLYKKNFMTEKSLCNLADFRTARFLCPLLGIKKLVYSDILEDAVIHWPVKLMKYINSVILLNRM